MSDKTTNANFASTMDNKPTRIPLAAKIVYTAFMAVLIPVYWWNYGPTNFLYFCDIALLLTLVGIWRESRLLIGISAVGIMVPQVLWCIDFGFGMFGSFPIGMTDYMFDPKLDLFLRGLSLFHGWLPFLLLWLVIRVGYDRRSFAWWWAISWAAMFVAYFFMPVAEIAGQPGNINYVYGLQDPPQTAMPQLAWFGIMLVAVPCVLALPAHLVMKRFLSITWSPTQN
jgi:hypothetical protein